MVMLSTGGTVSGKGNCEIDGEGWMRMVDEAEDGQVISTWGDM